MNEIRERAEKGEETGERRKVLIRREKKEVGGESCREEQEKVI